MPKRPFASACLRRTLALGAEAEDACFALGEQVAVASRTGDSHKTIGFRLTVQPEAALACCLIA